MDSSYRARHCVSFFNHAGACFKIFSDTQNLGKFGEETWKNKPLDGPTEILWSMKVCSIFVCIKRIYFRGVNNVQGIYVGRITHHCKYLRCLISSLTWGRSFKFDAHVLGCSLLIVASEGYIVYGYISYIIYYWG